MNFAKYFFIHSLYKPDHLFPQYEKYKNAQINLVI